VLALVETAHRTQARALIDTVRGYLEHRTSIGVNILVGSSVTICDSLLEAYVRLQGGTFHIELHIHSFAFAMYKPSSGYHRKLTNSPPRSQYVDSSFLEIPGLNLQEQGRPRIYKEQFSFAICGLDDRQWVAYAFVDSNINEEDSELDDCFSDPICSEGNIIVEADRPILDPRMYFLTVFRSRLLKVLRDWNLLVRTLERSIQTYVCNPLLWLDYMFQSTDSLIRLITILRCSGILGMGTSNMKTKLSVIGPIARLT
jgi:hypothetical protein